MLIAKSAVCAFVPRLKIRTRPNEAAAKSDCDSAPKAAEGANLNEINANQKLSLHPS